MKKLLYVIIFLLILSTLLVGCDTPSSNNHTHQWSEEVCGGRQHCLICNISNGFIVEHNWSAPICGQKQKCLRCNVEKDMPISHTTDDGVCDRCGQYYISQEKAIVKENARHQQTLQSLEDEYNLSYEKLNSKANEYKMHTTHTESYINSRLTVIANKLSILQTELMIAKWDTSISGKNKVQKLESEITDLETERTNLLVEENYWNKYKGVQESIKSLKASYNDKIKQENEMYEENINKINEDI